MNEKFEQPPLLWYHFLGFIGLVFTFFSTVPRSILLLEEIIDVVILAFLSVSLLYSSLHYQAFTFIFMVSNRRFLPSS